MKHNYIAIYETIAGSRLYGIETPTSDYDYRGIVFEPVESLLGLQKFEQYASKEEDRVLYSLRKWTKLALENNPNIIEMLFVPAEAVTVHTGYWQLLYESRFAFLSERVRKTFGGYAHSQLHRIKNHREWIENPPVPTDINYSSFIAWLATRNAERHELEVLYGYDTKHAAHLIRLLLQGITLLEKGDYCARLTGKERDLVMQIKGGAMAYDDLVKLSDDLFEVLKTCTTVLPKDPSVTFIENLVISLHRSVL